MKSFRPLVLASVSIAALTLTGCSADFGSAIPPSAAEQTPITGAVHGGQQAISGTTVTLIAPGITGYGSVGTILATTVTGSNGSFTLPNPLPCPGEQ